MVFCNTTMGNQNYIKKTVTILILIDGFLQFWDMERQAKQGYGHNPYFNRWFSAIKN